MADPVLHLDGEPGGNSNEYRNQKTEEHAKQSERRKEGIKQYLQISILISNPISLNVYRNL